MMGLLLCTVALGQAEIDPMADDIIDPMADSSVDPIVEEPVTKEADAQAEAQPATPTTPLRKLEFNKETAYLYRYELGAVGCIFLYLLMYRSGRAQNSHIIEQFYRQTRHYI